MRRYPVWRMCLCSLCAHVFAIDKQHKRFACIIDFYNNNNEALILSHTYKAVVIIFGHCIGIRIRCTVWCCQLVTELLSTVKHMRWIVEESFETQKPIDFDVWHNPPLLFANRFKRCQLRVAFELFNCKHRANTLVHSESVALPTTTGWFRNVNRYFFPLFPQWQDFVKFFFSFVPNNFSMIEKENAGKRL